MIKWIIVFSIFATSDGYNTGSFGTHKAWDTKEQCEHARKTAGGILGNRVADYQNQEWATVRSRCKPVER